MIKLNVINFINTQNTITGWGNNLLACLRCLVKTFLDGLSCIIGKGHPQLVDFLIQT